MNTTPAEWISPADLALRLDVTPRALRYWRAHGTGPRHAVMGRHVRYALSDVIAWEAEVLAVES